MIARKKGIWVKFLYTSIHMKYLTMNGMAIKNQDRHGAEFMKAKIFLITAMLFASLVVIVPIPVSAAPKYDWTHYDPKDDVMMYRTGGTFKFDNWNNVEITKMTSTYDPKTVSPLDDEIVLTMTVEGTIQNRDDYKYAFIVLADGEEYMFGAYQNDRGIGFKLGSKELMLGVEAEGENTDTLTITFNANNIGPPSSSFEFSGAAVYSVGESKRYLDLAAPDKLILITEPSDGSTVNGDITVKGVIRESIQNQPNGDVKISIDGTEDDVVMTGSDSWTYDLDTTTLSEGEHTIYVEVKDSGLDNADDEIKINVHQNTQDQSIYKSFTQKPIAHVGDWYHYETLGDAKISGINLGIDNEMDTRIEALETISVDSSQYETYRMKIETAGSQDLGYVNYTNENTRTSWRDSEDFGTIMENTVSIVDVTFRPETTVNTTTTYSPPLETHNKFSVKVGFNIGSTDIRWKLSTTADSDSTTTVEGQPPTSDSYKEALEVHGECLSYKSTYPVFGHNYQDIYVIRTYYENPGMSIVEYYSPELGVPVQMDTYDPSRELMFSLGLESWEQMPFSIVIEDITFEPEEPKAESEGKIIVHIKNVGAEEATNFGITVKDGTIQVGQQQTVTSISAGSTEEVSIDWTPKTEGTHTIEATATKGNTNLAERVENVEVGPPGEDGGFNVLYIFMIIVAVVVIILAVLLLKRKGAAKPKEEAVEAEATPVQEGAQIQTAAPAAQTAPSAPVTVAAEPEVVVAPAATTAPQEITETIQCPSCKQNFTVSYQSKPVRVKCPGCGTEGVLR